MNIVVLAHTFPLSPQDGTAHFMYDFAQGLQQANHHVTVILPYHPELQPRSFTTFPVIPFHYAPLKRLHLFGFGRTFTTHQAIRWQVWIVAPLYLLASIWALYRTVKKTKAELISIHWIIPNGLAGVVVSALTGVPFTISLPGSDVYLTRRSPLWRFLALTIASRAIRVIADSPQLLQDLGIRGSVIPYGVPLNQSQGTHHAQAVVVTAGKAIVKTGVPLVQTLDPTIQVLSGLSIAAFRQALTGVDIFVKLSLKDKQGNLEDSSVAVLEAMSAGCAVIVSDLPGYRTFIKDGHNGLLVDPRNHQAVLSAIHILRSSPQLRHQLGQAAQATIAASHTPLQVAQRYLKTIGEPASAQDPALP